jgi:hypothetical protein
MFFPVFRTSTRPCNWVIFPIGAAKERLAVKMKINIKARKNKSFFMLHPTPYILKL